MNSYKLAIQPTIINGFEMYALGLYQDAILVGFSTRWANSDGGAIEWAHNYIRNQLGVYVDIQINLVSYKQPT